MPTQRAPPLSLTGVLHVVAGEGVQTKKKKKKERKKKKKITSEFDNLKKNKK